MVAASTASMTSVILVWRKPSLWTDISQSLSFSPKLTTSKPRHPSGTIFCPNQLWREIKLVTPVWPAPMVRTCLFWIISRLGQHMDWFKMFLGATGERRSYPRAPAGARMMSGLKTGICWCWKEEFWAETEISKTTQIFTLGWAAKSNKNCSQAPVSYSERRRREEVTEVLRRDSTLWRRSRLSINTRFGWDSSD